MTSEYQSLSKESLQNTVMQAITHASLLIGQRVEKIIRADVLALPESFIKLTIHVWGKYLDTISSKPLPLYGEYTSVAQILFPDNMVVLSNPVNFLKKVVLEDKKTGSINPDITTTSTPELEKVILYYNGNRKQDESLVHIDYFVYKRGVIGLSESGIHAYRKLPPNIIPVLQKIHDDFI